MSLEIIVENSTLTFDTVVPAELIITQTGTETLTISDTGPRGPVGYGVAAGGASPQVLHKLSGSDYDTGWAQVSAPNVTLSSTHTANTNVKDAIDECLTTRMATGGTASQFLVKNSGTNYDTSWKSRPKSRTILTGSGTWTKPDGATFVRVTVQGAGGGGGAGGASSSTTVMSGGGGGCGGSSQMQVFLAAEIADSIAYSCGVGGGGGTGNLSTFGGANANGLAGSRGGSTSFGTLLFAAGGYFGSGGTTTAGTGGVNTNIYNHGASPQTDAGNGGNGTNVTSLGGYNAISGGGGGGGAASNADGAAGGAGRAYLTLAPTTTTQRGNGASGGLYNNNGSTAATIAHGGGGAGGYNETVASGTTTGKTGGAGHLGGGGGGGGACTTGGGGANARGGTGGAGGDGYIEVMVW